MEKFLSAVVLTSLFAFLLTAPVLLVPTAVSAAVTDVCTNGCSLTSDCTCGGAYFPANNNHYCLNNIPYAPTQEGLAACNAAVSGGGGGTGGGYQTAPTLLSSPQALIALITRVGNWIFSILLGIASIMLILAGFWWVTAGGNPEGVKKASDTLRNALIGVAIALGAKGLVLVIRGIIGG